MSLYIYIYIYILHFRDDIDEMLLLPFSATGKGGLKQLIVLGDGAATCQVPLY